MSVTLRLQVAGSIVFTWAVGPACFLMLAVPTAQVTSSGECTVYNVYPTAQAQAAGGLMTVILQFIIPLILLAILYGRMAVVLHKRVGIVQQPGRYGL